MPGEVKLSYHKSPKVTLTAQITSDQTWCRLDMDRYGIHGTKLPRNIE